MRAGSLRGCPASQTSTRRRHRPSTSAALRPAGPPPMTMASRTSASEERDGWGVTITAILKSSATAQNENQHERSDHGNNQGTDAPEAVGEEREHLPLNRRCSRKRFSDGGRAAARWLQLRRGRRDNVISCVVRPIVSICGKEKATFASSDLSARRGENQVFRTQKA